MLKRRVVTFRLSMAFGITAAWSVMGAALESPTISELPRLEPRGFLAPGGFHLFLDGKTGSNYVLETSATQENWSTLTTITLIDSPFSLIDRTVSPAVVNRFYRARLAGAPPFIITHPSSRIVAVGENTFFAIAAQGTEPLAYSWLFNGAALPGATQAALILTNVQRVQEGSYAVQVSNPDGTAKSLVASLSVLPPDRAPRSLVGRKLSAEIATGSIPFASSGRYAFVFGVIEDSYVVLPGDSSVASSHGAYRYVQKDDRTGELTFEDSGTDYIPPYTGTSVLSFQEENRGTFIHKGLSGEERGSFIIE
jgi:hypothetical protein